MNTAFIDALRKEYIENHTREQHRDDLIQENHIEKRDVIGYHGREILELLQNADDAYQKSIDQGNRPDIDLIVEISYKDCCLKISNTGTFFDEDGIKAIVQGNNSPKKGKYIGNKGTGFRSILNWACSVRIFSGEFAVEFSKDYAKEIFDTIKEKPQIAKQLQKEKNLYIPMLAVPKNITHDRPNDRTTIEIDVDPKKSEDEYSVKKQLETIDLRILMFLPNVSEISIIIDDKHVVYKRSKLDSLNEVGLSWDDVNLSKVVNDEVECSEQFKLFTKTIEYAVKENEDDESLKDVHMAIAVPIKVERTIEHLYSFFPLLDTDAPFNCVMHATYALSDHRNTLTPSTVNKKIGQYQIDFLFSIADYLSGCDANCAQKILSPKTYHNDLSKIFPVSFSKLSLEEYFVKGVCERKIFLTVNDELISINDKPKIIERNYPDCFKGESFEKLLKNDANEYSLLHLVSARLGIDLKFKSEELCDAIDIKSKEWTIAERVETFIWWNEHGNANYLPKLLKTRNGLEEGRWLECKEECYFLEGDFDSLVLPNWVKIIILADEDQRELVEQSLLRLNQVSSEEQNIRSSVIRSICMRKIYPCLDFKYRDKSHVLALVNSSVNDYGTAIEFVKWLWQNKIPPQKEIGNSTNKLTLNFPSANKTIAHHDKLFFGKSYGCELNGSLFNDDYTEFPDPSEFGIKSCENTEFKTYIQNFGVLAYPKIELLDIEKPIASYDERMRKRIKDTGVFNGTNSSYIVNSHYKVPYVKNLESILTHLTMCQVVQWILNDSMLSEYLRYEVYPSSDSAHVDYYGNFQRTWREYDGDIDNYILATFRNTPWIIVNGERKKTLDVLDAYSNRNNERFEKYLPVLTIDNVEKIALNLKVSIEDVKSVLSYFSFPKNVTDLSSDSFYGLMLALQETDILKEEDLALSRTVYRIVEQADFNRDFEASQNKDRYFKEGKLLVKYQGKLQYWLASDSILPSTKIIFKNALPIIEKNVRTNSKNFVRVFGCKEYNSNYYIIPQTAKVSNKNPDFQLYFSEFIKYAKAFSERNENIGTTINRLKITIVNEISIIENGEKRLINTDYTLLRSSNSDWYIVVNMPDYDINRISECVENVFANIANTPGFEVSKLGELFRTSSLETREFLIQKEFGTLDVIHEDLGRNPVKENFLKTLEVMGMNVAVDDLGIDFEEFGSINNAGNLVNFFKEYNVDLDKFSDAGFVYPIDLRRYWKRQLENIVRDKEEIFKSYLYTQAKHDLSLRSNFVRTLREFASFPELSIPNTVFFNPLEELKKRFGDWTIHEPNDINVVDIYNANFAKMNPKNLYPDEIGNDEAVQVMIYFGLEEEFSLWIETQNKEETKNPVDFGVQVYERYKNICPEKVAVSYSEKQAISKGNIMRNFSYGVHSLKKSHQQECRLKEIGNSGELLVYNYLLSKYHVVEAKSEAFVQMGIIAAGQAMSGGYDMLYKDGDKTIYVEVKTGEGNRFYLSPNELAFAREHADCYHVYYVTDLNTDKPKISVLADKFWEDERYTMREIIESIEFTF